VGNAIDLDGVALVTGGRGALGRALCERLSSAGMTAVSVDLPGLGADVDLDVTDAQRSRAQSSRSSTSTGDSTSSSPTPVLQPQAPSRRCRLTRGRARWR